MSKKCLLIGATQQRGMKPVCFDDSTFTCQLKAMLNTTVAPEVIELADRKLTVYKNCSAVRRGLLPNAKATRLFKGRVCVRGSVVVTGGRERIDDEDWIDRGLDDAVLRTLIEELSAADDILRE